MRNSRDRLIALRALNSLRGVHLPTYVALRVLINTLPSAVTCAGVSEIVERLSYSRNSRLFDLPRFKAMGPNDIPVYRDYTVAAPTHALAEAYALLILQESAQRSNRDFVYSYRCPESPNHPRNFQHFSAGYLARNSDVLRAMDDGSVAVSFDLRSFYPSVDGARTVKGYLAQLDRTSISEASLRVIEKCANACIAEGEGGGGLRVGLEMSHLLADFAANGLDRALRERFGSKYFRYVDDLVIVCSAADVDVVRAYVVSVVANEGFTLNNEKESVATRTAWAAYRFGQVGVDVLSAFKFRLKVFLATKPEHFLELKDWFGKVGIRLPLESFLESTSASSWRERVAAWWWRGWRVLRGFDDDTVDNIREEALICQGKLREEFKRLGGEPLPDGGVERKWAIQKLRFVINRSLYFLPVEEISLLLKPVAGVPELVETASVAEALVSGDYRGLAKMPGAAAAAASQLAAFAGHDRSAVLDIRRALVKRELIEDVAAHFAVRSETPVDIDVFEGEVSPVLDFALARGTRPSFDGSIGYAEELLGLGAHVTRGELAALASVRLYPGEEIALDALTLGSGYQS